MLHVAMLDTAAIFGWLELLDQLDYYAVLDVDHTADQDDLKRAFHVFASKFHPDGHMWRTDEEQEAVDKIFKRGTEAYSVLGDPQLRDHYDTQLANAPLRNSSARMTSMPPANARSSQLPPRLEDTVRTPSARPFARRAEELIVAGDLKQAKLQLQMAAHHDPENGELQDYLSRIDYQIKAKP